MATPTFHKPPPSGEDIVKRLEDELIRQREITPEPEFQRPSIEDSYKWLCEIEHNRFQLGQIEQLRTEICNPYYWKLEAHTLLDMFVEDSSTVDKQPLAYTWRGIARKYSQKLKRRGFSAQQLMSRRLAIEDQKYWEPEATRLRQIASYREAQRIEQLLEMENDTRKGKTPNLTTSRGNAQNRKQRKAETALLNRRSSAPRRTMRVPPSDRVLRSSRNSKIEKPGGKQGR